MSKLIVCIGPPGCGKNQWVQKELKASKGNAIAVCRDDLRQMIAGGNIHDYKFSSANETAITLIASTAITDALNAKKTVYVPDTNYNSNTIQAFTEIAKKTNSIVIKHDFFEEFKNEQLKLDPTQVIETIVERFRKRCKDWNLKRSKAVPESVIDKFFDDYIVPANNTVKKYIPDVNKPKAIIVDLDGTLFHMVNRSPFDFSKVDTDIIDTQVLNSIKLYAANGYKIILASGRDDSCMDLTIKSLQQNNVPYDKLFMRITGDQRADWIAKEEIFFNNIAPYYNVEVAFDDRNQVVDRYRAMGIKVYQVQPGNF